MSCTVLMDMGWGSLLRTRLLIMLYITLRAYQRRKRETVVAGSIKEVDWREEEPPLTRSGVD